MFSKSNSSFFRPLFLMANIAFAAGTLTGCHLYLDDSNERPQDESGPEDCWDCGGLPPDAGGGWECNTNEACAAGCYCSDANWCEESGFCDESHACFTGFVCDFRSTCVPENSEPAQTCQSEVLSICDEMVPICPIGTTPIIELGCYTGDCMDKADCPDGAPFACGDLDASEDACIANAACSPVYKGVNCTSQTGAECTDGAGDCTCESFELDRCDTVAS